LIDAGLRYMSSGLGHPFERSDQVAIVTDATESVDQRFVYRTDFTHAVFLRAGGNLRRIEGAMGLFPGTLDDPSVRLVAFQSFKPSLTAAMIDPNAASTLVSGTVNKAWPVKVLDGKETSCRSIPLQDAIDGASSLDC
jgi:hypothetical protein